MKKSSESHVSEPAVTDEQLVKLVLAGETDLFALLYERYYWRAFRTAYGMTGDHGAAEDLTQEIFMRAYQRLKDFRAEAAFSTWFYRLAVNHSLNYRRKHQAGTHEEAADQHVSVAEDLLNRRAGRSARADTRAGSSCSADPEAQVPNDSHSQGYRRAQLRRDSPANQLFPGNRSISTQSLEKTTRS